MVVQHNLTAMNSNRMLGITTKSQAKATEKLSSGYKINRAADDAAGLSISEKMRKQIRGLSQASLNAQDGISAVQTAEGALTEVHDMLQRMNELAVKAANGTNSSDDRDYIQSEVDQLVIEIDRVATTTKFNETHLLKGINKDGTVGKLSFDEARTTFVTDKEYSFDESGVGTVEITKIPRTVPSAVEDLGHGYGGVHSTYNEITMTVNGEQYAFFSDFCPGKMSVSLSDYLAGKSEASTTTMEDVVNLHKHSNSDYITYGDRKEFEEVLKTLAGANYKNIEVGGDATKTTITLVAFADVNLAADIVLHVGADSSRDNKIELSIRMMSARGLGINGIKVNGSDSINATNAINIIDSAIQMVSEQRSTLGAVQNRLEHTIANLDNIVENTTSAESAIRDTDMAKQMVEYSNNNILAQAGQAMLAQANQSNQGVLSLLQ